MNEPLQESWDTANEAMQDGLVEMLMEPSDPPKKTAEVVTREPLQVGELVMVDDDCGSGRDPCPDAGRTGRVVSIDPEKPCPIAVQFPNKQHSFFEPEGLVHIEVEEVPGFPVGTQVSLVIPEWSPYLYGYSPEGTVVDTTGEPDYPLLVELGNYSSGRAGVDYIAVHPDEILGHILPETQSQSEHPFDSEIREAASEAVAESAVDFDTLSEEEWEEIRKAARQALLDSYDDVADFYFNEFQTIREALT